MNDTASERQRATCSGSTEFPRALTGLVDRPMVLADSSRRPDREGCLGPDERPVGRAHERSPSVGVADARPSDQVRSMTTTERFGAGIGSAQFEPVCEPMTSPA